MYRALWKYCDIRAGWLQQYCHWKNYCWNKVWCKFLASMKANFMSILHGNEARVIVETRGCSVQFTCQVRKWAEKQESVQLQLPLNTFMRSEGPSRNVLLDTYTFTKIWRRKQEEPEEFAIFLWIVWTGCLWWTDFLRSYWTSFEKFSALL